MAVTTIFHIIANHQKRKKIVRKEINIFFHSQSCSLLSICFSRFDQTPLKFV